MERGALAFGRADTGHDRLEVVGYYAGDAIAALFGGFEDLEAFVVRQFGGRHVGRIYVKYMGGLVEKRMTVEKRVIKNELLVEIQELYRTKKFQAQTFLN